MEITDEIQAACEEWYEQNEETESTLTAFAAGMSFGIKRAADIADRTSTEYETDECCYFTSRYIADAIRKEWPTAEPEVKHATTA